MKKKLTIIVLLDASRLKQLVAVFGGAFEAELVPGFAQGDDFFCRIDRLGASRTHTRHLDTYFVTDCARSMAVAPLVSVFT